MKIYSMTATFGKLEHETLTLQPGLNVIHAPNEWGKSTWCAFLVNMLYGVDTRAKSTKTTLADKERYAPWSGAPMSGRIELNWNGRDITIERKTKGRLIFGDFRAYETETGIDIPELTAANCGTVLLGAERSVFERAGFLRLGDLPVTQDDALRRRLNDLVTTGDESGAGDRLGKQLKDLKNKCRFNRTGLLPQAEAQREQLQTQLDELLDLNAQSVRLTQRVGELEGRIHALENHKAALRYAASQADAQRVAQADAALEEARQACDRLENTCQGLPTQEEAQAALQTGRSLQQQRSSLEMETRMLPPLPEAPAVPAHFQSLTPVEAEAAAREDLDALSALEAKMAKKSRISTVISLLCGLVLAGLAVARFAFAVDSPILFLAVGIALLLTVVIGSAASIRFTTRWRKSVETIYDRHPGIPADRWLEDVEAYRASQAAYQTAYAQALALRGDLDQRQADLDWKIQVYARERSLEECIARWQQVLSSHTDLQNVRRDLARAKDHAEVLRSMAKTAQPPQEADELTLSEADTDTLLQTARFELRQQQQKLGQYQGRAEALGQEAVLRAQLKAVNQRISQLEETYAALELAQKALSAATTQLQRRFAPRISKRAQALFAALTDNRYQRITLGEDLSLNACTQDEETLRAALWRSDGTVDQLYLALRLAVAEELTPNAPLVLDDALVRFDERRLAAAMDILKETGEHKQVILFTCQDREERYL